MGTCSSSFNDIDVFSLMKRSGHGLAEDILLAFALRQWRNHTKTRQGRE
jgi:hypothetical protein